MGKGSEKHREYRAWATLNACSSTAYRENQADDNQPFVDSIIRPMVGPIIGRNDFVLDVGVGNGLELLALKASGVDNVVGFTSLHEDVVNCNRLGFECARGDINFIARDFHGWVENMAQYYNKQYDKYVDVIIARHILEHSPFPFLVLEQFHEILKDRGHCYIEVPSPDTEAGHEFNKNHWSVIGDRMWQSLFGRAGFNLVSGHTLSFDIPQPDGRTIRDTYFGYILQKGK